MISYISVKYKYQELCNFVKKKEFQKTKQFNKSATLLEKYYAEGKMTEAQYNKELDRILKEFTRE